MKRRILLSGGGTAGSVTPLIALKEQLERQHHDIEFLFLGSADGPERVLATAAHIPFRSISGGKFRRYWSWKNVSDLGSIWRGFRQSQKIMKEWRPDVCVSAGSFISVPVIWAAHRAGVRTIIHQQDVRPGLANRFMVYAADIITVTFQRSMKKFPKNKVRWIGNPVRLEVLAGDMSKARELFHLPEHAPVLLVIGGGTGSSSINSIIGAMAFHLVQQWSIIHVTGPDRDFVELHDPHYQRFPFLTWQLPHALAAADVVVTRAGLGIFSELAALAKAAIFIPLPNSHQEDNAAVVSEASAGIVIQQNSQTGERLAEALETLRRNPAERQRLGRNLHQFYNPDALTKLSDAVLHVASV